jgi:hypothetical protein
LIANQDVKAANVAAMGQVLGELYSALWQEVARVFGKWEEYVELFGTKESRIHLMNEAASDFFGKLQESGFKEVLLDIACLIDPPKSVGRENLSLQALPDLIQDAALRQRVGALIADAVQKSSFARDWRNRYLAHRDRALALGSAHPLAPASREATWTALRSLGAVLNEVEYHYKNSTTIFESGVGALGGAEALLYVIDDGVRAERERRLRLETGNVLEADYNRSV